VHLPYSLGPPRPDRDNKNEYCSTCDFAVSTYTFMRAQQNPQIMKMLVDTACDGMASQFLKGHEEVKKDYKIMQRMPCKGGQPMPMPQMHTGTYVSMPTPPPVTLVGAGAPQSLPPTPAPSYSSNTVGSTAFSVVQRQNVAVPSRWPPTPSTRRRPRRRVWSMA